METTFILAEKFGVTPFEIMAQEIDEVILVINYFIDRNKEGGKYNNIDNTLNEKEKDKDFWACL